MNLRSATVLAERAAAMLVVLVLAPPTAHRGAGSRQGGRSDRGDVPGWVMITMMTALVVIALLVVFRDIVKQAVVDAFNSITNSD